MVHQNHKIVCVWKSGFLKSGHIYVRILVQKQMSILTFEGLSATFEASTNVYFTYFCHKIICSSDYTCITVASKMLTSLLSTYIISSFGCSCKGQGLLKKHSKVGTFEGLFESSTFVYALMYINHGGVCIIKYLHGNCVSPSCVYSVTHSLVDTQTI